MADNQMRLQRTEASAMAGGWRHEQQQHQRPDRESGGENRPSFTEYWREEKENERAGTVRFVEDGPAPPHQHPSSSSPSSAAGPNPAAPLQPSGQERERQGSSESTSALTPAETAKDKAKLRRQQVRKAQIQHRTRKANYIKQLELDACRFRDMIAAAEKEVLAFRRENEGMRGALTARGLRVPGELKGEGVVVHEVRICGSQEPVDAVAQRQETAQPVTVHHQPPQKAIVQPGPQQQVPAAPPAPEAAYQPQPEDDDDDYDPYPPAELFADVNMGEVTVTMRKDDTLGTPCFQITSSSPAVVYSRPTPTALDQLTPEQEITAINLILAMEHICWNHFHPRQFPSHADPCSAASGHTMMASTMCMSSAPARVYRTIRRGEADTTAHTWRADTGAGSSLSLKSLLSLAKTLNPGDIELTPVQAWFELAARYGAAALMQGNVIEALKREFCGVVDCIHFGAIIERDAFESVVARVMEQVGVREMEWEMDVDDGYADAPVGTGMAFGAQRVAA